MLVSLAAGMNRLTRPGPRGVALRLKNAFLEGSEDVVEVGVQGVSEVVVVEPEEVDADMAVAGC